MKKIKVMHVLCMGAYSGAENVTITLINSVKDEVDSIYVSPSGSIQDILKENNIQHYSVKKVTVKNVKKAIKQIQPDIIHAHDFNAGVVSAMSTSKIPIVNHLHNNASWIKKWCVKSLAYGLVSWRFSKILAVSESIMDEYVLGKWLKNKTSVVGNPLDLEKIKEKAEKATINTSSDIMFLGRLSEPKNPLMFIEIINKLVKKNPRLQISVVGDGELREQVERKIVDLRLTKNINLWGFQKNPYGLLNNTKVVCMPSKWEGFGLAAVEALTLGKPVIATPVGGLSNIICDECGCLCNSEDSFVEEIYALLNNTLLYKEKAKKAIKRAQEFDNIKEYSKCILSLYYSVIDLC